MRLRAALQTIGHTLQLGVEARHERRVLGDHRERRRLPPFCDTHDDSAKGAISVANMYSNEALHGQKLSMMMSTGTSGGAAPAATFA
eukprot:COSAG01_NODE_42607_length_438_cov_0.917404_1_plen_86_part_10